MSEPWLGQIYLVGYNFAQRGFAFCDGQLQSISQNSALFSLLGTIYGGDGRTTFGLPDLRGRTAIGRGRGPGLTDRRLGEKSGQERVTLTTMEMPSHNHTASSFNEDGDLTTPSGNVPAKSAAELIYSNETPDTTMRSNMIGNTGGGQSHNNMQPYLVLNYEIALQGAFPSRN